MLTWNYVRKIEIEQLLVAGVGNPLENSVRGFENEDRTVDFCSEVIGALQATLSSTLAGLIGRTERRRTSLEMMAGV